jgi:putative isomerase
VGDGAGRTGCSVGWDNETVMGEVLLPQGLEIRVGIKQNSTENSNAFLRTALIGRRGMGEEEVHPGPHSYDGSYSELRVTWHGYSWEIESAHAGSDLVLLVTPISRPHPESQPLSAVFSAGMLWNKPGTVVRDGDRIVATIAGSTLPIYLAGKDSGDLHIPVVGAYFSALLDGPVGVSTGSARTVAEVKSIMARQRAAFQQEMGDRKNQVSEVREAIETTIAWDTIYEPAGRRVITPVSRIWNENWGGYVLFDWDTFFAASLAAVDDKNLAYANVLEILNEMTPEGFVPNYGRAGGWKSSDRSEPPVGAVTVLPLYRKFGDRWLLEQTFARLLRWNTWWAEHRVVDGYLAWGSDGENKPVNIDDTSRGTMQGARYESGLDNSPMYDTPSYDEKTHTMMLADVGLMSMFIADSDALAEIADVLGKPAEAQRLRAQSAAFRVKLETLWDAKTGMYLNKDLRTGELSRRISPTNFYPLLAKAPDREQANEMIAKHLLNPDEFWGERVIPSIARSDPAFKDQDYWRGRIWGPMNYLVYLGLRNYDSPEAMEARRELARKSTDLFLLEWRTKGHVHENYSAVQDDSDTVTSSDRFYHWGALLGLIGLEEAETK